MASSQSSAKNDGKGAAEEPDSEPEGSLPSSTTASYDPTVFQRPHPDDRGGGGNGKPRKTDGGEGKPKTKDGQAKDGKVKTKTKGGLSRDFCGDCGAEGELRKCKQCGAVAYCGEACQRVSAMAWGWERRTRASAPC